MGKYLNLVAFFFKKKKLQCDIYWDSKYVYTLYSTIIKHISLKVCSH